TFCNVRYCVDLVRLQSNVNSTQQERSDRLFNQQMSIITLTTDMGTRDHYVGVLRGSIYKQFPEAIIVDLSHHVKPFFVPGAAMVVKNSFKSFPKGTVHLIGVSPNRTELVDHLAVEYEGQYFVGADNGMYHLICDREPERIFDLSRVAESAASVLFPTRDVFAVAACHLAKGGIMEVLGKPATINNELKDFVPIIDGNTIRGLAIHIDVYGNVITNIENVLFETVGQGRSFEIRFRKLQHVINKIYTSYADVPSGEKMALFGASGFLELAINGSNASQLLGVKREDLISVVFNPE
ncbi:MAG: SAM-dependent chlorinase/fluorinase, partial [Flavobacteriales bacterium]|nr:SAM-dependent chlorinase/fluorinase [Flavobacteriales bacterium]